MMYSQKPSKSTNGTSTSKTTMHVSPTTLQNTVLELSVRFNWSSYETKSWNWSIPWSIGASLWRFRWICGHGPRKNAKSTQNCQWTAEGHFWLRQDATFQSHVNKTVSSCFYQLRRLKSSVKILPFETAKTWVNSFVISRIDYCNSPLAGAPQYLLNRFQRVMNEAARMLCRCSRGDHVNRIMKERLHWLRIPQRIQFKLCLLVYKSLHGTAPKYLSELVNQVNTNDARRRLRSATIDDLIVPRTRNNFGQHAFAVAGPIAWNSLP